MDFNKLIGIAIAAFGVAWFKKVVDKTATADNQDDYADIELDSKDDDIDNNDHSLFADVIMNGKFEEKNKEDSFIVKDDNGEESLYDSHPTDLKKSPIFSVAMRSGGQMLEQNEIILHITNPSDLSMELSDFRSTIWVGGYKADLCSPASMSSIKIPGKEKVSFILYAGYGKMFTEYVNVKRALNMLFDGKNSTTMRQGTFIPLEDSPVIMNIECLVSEDNGDKEECLVFDIPGSYRWKYAGWVAGNAGYNADKKNESNSHWSKYEDQQPIGGQYE